MAGYRQHLMVSTVLGSAYASAGVWYLHMDWGTAFLGPGLASLGGMLPDLDSDSGVPVREMFGFAAAVIPMLMYETFQMRFGPEEIEKPLVVALGTYLVVRYGVSNLFKKLSVHRGMFHSVPTMLITGLIVFLLYQPTTMLQRLFVSCGVMLGFLSHLLLDELYSVDLMGGKLRLNKFAGSAFKFYSKSKPGTLITYVILAVLSWGAWLQISPETMPAFLNPFQ